MDYTIRVTKSPNFLELNAPELFVRKFNNSDDYIDVLKLCQNKRRINWLESLITPVRTDNFNNFCKDFFLPGLFNLALKTEDVALKFFFCIITPICDIITFPARLITVIPQFIYNAKHPKEAHPFYKFLIDNGVNAADLNEDHVYLETKYENSKTVRTTGITFNFVHLPISASDMKTHEQVLSK